MAQPLLKRKNSNGSIGINTSSSSKSSSSSSHDHHHHHLLLRGTRVCFHESSLCEMDQDDDNTSTGTTITTIAAAAAASTSSSSSSIKIFKRSSRIVGRSLLQADLSRQEAEALAKELGADVQPRLKDDTTHLVVGNIHKSSKSSSSSSSFSSSSFPDLKTTHLVTLQWLVACRAEGTRVPELFYLPENKGVLRNCHVVCLGFNVETQQSMRKFVEQKLGGQFTALLDPSRSHTLASQNDAMKLLPAVPSTATHVVVPHGFPELSDLVNKLRKALPHYCTVVTSDWLRFLAWRREFVSSSLMPECFEPLPMNPAHLAESGFTLDLSMIHDFDRPLFEALAKHLRMVARDSFSPNTTHVLIPSSRAETAGGLQNGEPHRRDLEVRLITEKPPLLRKVLKERFGPTGLNFRVVTSTWMLAYARHHEDYVGRDAPSYEIFSQGTDNRWPDPFLDDADAVVEIQNIMTGIVAFVARSIPEQQKEDLLKSLTAMGGQASSSVTEQVTHFIASKPSPIDHSDLVAAKKYQSPVVSSRWIVECWNQKALLEPRNFPLDSNDRRSLPVNLEEARSVPRKRKATAKAPGDISFSKAMRVMEEQQQTLSRDSRKKGADPVFTTAFEARVETMRQQDPTPQKPSVEQLNTPASIPGATSDDDDDAGDDEDNLRDALLKRKLSTLPTEFIPPDSSRSNPEFSASPSHSLAETTWMTPLSEGDDGQTDALNDTCFNALENLLKAPTNRPSIPIPGPKPRPVGPPIAVRASRPVDTGNKEDAPRLVNGRSEKAAKNLKRKVREQRTGGSSVADEGDSMEQDIGKPATSWDGAAEFAAEAKNILSSQQSMDDHPKSHVRSSKPASRSVSVGGLEGPPVVVLVGGPREVGSEEKKCVGMHDRIILHRQITLWTNVVVCVSNSPPLSEKKVLSALAVGASIVTVEWLREVGRNPAASSDFSIRQKYAYRLSTTRMQESVWNAAKTRFDEKRNWVAPLKGLVMWISPIRDSADVIKTVAVAGGARCIWNELDGVYELFRSKSGEVPPGTIEDVRKHRFFCGAASEWIAEHGHELTICMAEKAGESCEILTRERVKPLHGTISVRVFVKKLVAGEFPLPTSSSSAAPSSKQQVVPAGRQVDVDLT